MNVSDFGKYLGVPSVFSRSKTKDLAYILDRTWKAVQGWKRSLFSLAGKETLIKSVGQAIPSYAMSVFRFPKKLCEDISRNFARFWWGSNENKKKMHWCSWDKLCLPKSLGGLNFRDLEGFNKALVAKQVWRLMAFPNSLVARFIKSLYFRNCSILEAEEGKSSSYIWKSLIWGRDLLRKGLRFRLGNGEKIAMFDDPWIPKENTFKPICINRNFWNEKVVDFISPSGDWNIMKLEQAVLSCDVEEIRKIPINKNLEDRMIWHYDKLGKYTVKSGYKLFIKEKIDGISPSSNIMSKVWNSIWNLKVPPKIKHFFWKALNNIFPTKINLKNRGVDNNLLCPVCSNYSETTDHILFKCKELMRFGLIPLTVLF